MKTLSAALYLVLIFQFLFFSVSCSSQKKENDLKKKENVIISPDTKRENRKPPGQRIINGWPVYDITGIPQIDTADWKLKIDGLVLKEKTVSFSEFNNFPKVTVYSDIHCVTTWSNLDNYWEGVSTSYLKEIVEIKPEAKFVMISCEDGYSTNLPIEDFFREDVLFAMKLNDEIIDAPHGYPVRLVVPHLYFWKSAKWVTRVEFMEEDEKGYWEKRGYHNYGDPWKEQRYAK